MIKSKISKNKLIVNIIAISFILIASVFFVAARYKDTNFKDSQIDEVLFYVMNGATNGQSGNFREIVQDNLLSCLTVFFLLLLPIIDFYTNKIRIKVDLKFLGKSKDTYFNPSNISVWLKLLYSFIVLLISIWCLLNSFGISAYLRSLNESSQLYEKYYVEPRGVKLIFPEQKRNLIYIYLESMENTLTSTANGGQSERSIIPELESLALDPNNVSFSNNETGLGGALPAHGTTWTVAAMMAQSSGVPLKTSNLLPIGEEGNGYGNFDRFVPGAYSIGDILKKQGYSQTFIMGSDASFGGRDKMLSQHGSYMVKDYVYAKENGLIPEDYSVWWGYEDKKVFEIAKQELSSLSRLDKPFNVQLLTADTHYTDGYLDPSCSETQLIQYDAVHACSSKEVSQFIEWVRQQPYADNTTIVVAGDHLGMQSLYYQDKITDTGYQRTTYNLFINSIITPVTRNNRKFTTLDMYPSTLAAMGVTIEGNRLGLGVNLFSEEPTLVERLGGLNELNNELSKRSTLYERSILTSVR